MSRPTWRTGGPCGVAAELSAAPNHHVDIDLRPEGVTVRLFTHEPGGLSKRTALTRTATPTPMYAATTRTCCLPRRWVVERSLARITRHRCCARDYEAPTRTHHEAMVRWATIRITSKRLTRTRGAGDEPV